MSEKLNNSLIIAEPQNNSVSAVWQCGISFGKSSSSNYSKAIALSKSSQEYVETFDENNHIIHQAIFDKEHFLDFVSLYDLVHNWKSAFVFINGNRIDKKIISGINYCYGDRIRSGNQNFCFGASEWTENPFGCHRARIHKSGTPWYNFGTMDKDKRFHIDKERLRSQSLERLRPYKFCPALDIKAFISKISELPDIIDPSVNSEWVYTTFSMNGAIFDGVMPKAYLRSPIIEEVVLKIKLDASPVDNKQQSSQNIATKAPTGCLLPVVILLIIITFGISTIFL